MRRTKPHGISRRLTAMVLCLCMIVSMVSGFGATTAAASGVGPTEKIVAGTRVADPDTMDDYLNRLLTETSGSRYAGRVWTDKTVFAYGDSAREGDSSHFDGNNTITLDMDTDGYNGDVLFNSDFAHVFSALASSQVVNEYPPSPVDLVIVFDMSGSMGQDTRYSIDPGQNVYQAHVSSTDGWPVEGVPMAERITNSRIQITLDAINQTIDKLMAQNPQNRVAVCGYGANAVVLMPLGHYRRSDVNGDGQIDEKNDPYLTVGGMETLYHPSDLVYKEESRGDTIGYWCWMNNRDTCYTVVLNAEYNTYTGVLNEDGDNTNDCWREIKKTVSNNALDNNGQPVKAFPGAWEEDGKTPKSDFKEQSKSVYNGASTNQPGYGAGENGSQIITEMENTASLTADDYVGYFTNTQGGIYLAYKQLADSAATTYTEELSNGVISTVARIPAAIIMSDGGANFSFNEMGIDPESESAVAKWNGRYGQPSKPESPPPDNVPDWYINDNSWDTNNWPTEIDSVPVIQADRSHRLGGCIKEGGDIETEQKGDEWYKVFLPGKDTLGADWNGIHGIFNFGADYYKDGTLTTQPAWNHAGVLYSSDNTLAGTAGTTMEVLLTAAYMNAVVKEHYDNGWKTNNATLDSQIPLSTYTMNVDTEHVPQWGRWRLYPTLDPKEYPIDDVLKWCNDTKLFGEKFGGDSMGSEGESYHKAVFEGLLNSWNSWKSGKTVNVAMVPPIGEPRIRIEPIAEADEDSNANYYTTGPDGKEEIISVDDADVLDNISYNNEFYDVKSGDLDSTFDDILALILGKVFVPVSGDNDAGVGDSITYQDPIGEYMEIKNGSINATPHHIVGNPVEETEKTYDMALLLFGEMHGLVRTGVYDFHWNDEWIGAHHPGMEGTAAMEEGWYLGDDPTTAQSGGAGEVPLDEGGEGDRLFDDANAARAAGWIYRLNYKTVQQYVPILGETEKPSELPDQVKNTVYTLYRFAGDADDRNMLRRNPIYGEGVPETIKKAWQDYYAENDTYPETIEEVGDTSEYPGIYRLSDIRVWVEETGDFVDEDGRITPNTGYDRSLYVNIPAAAIPTELATITLGKDGVLSYETNLGSDHPVNSKITVEEDGEKVEKVVRDEDYKNFCYQSTPFRLFYAVGLEEDLILRDEDGSQTGVDFNAISPEYIQSHTVEGQDYIWFISNFYSESRYGEYTTDDITHTRGDPTVSFSPGADNRYYVFQKPLSLYAHAYRANGGGLTPVDKTGEEAWGSNRSGNGKTTWEDGQTGANWGGGQYMGTYENANKFKDAFGDLTTGKDEKQYITDSSGIKYEYVENGIVFLQEDLLEHVTSTADGGYTKESVSFNSDDYFFILLEFYVPYKGTTGVDNEGKKVQGTQAGHMVQYALARRGSEFGSGYTSDKIDNGDMLCWTDVQDHLNVEFAYLSKTDTGDRTRGEPTLEKLTYAKDGGSGKNLNAYLESIGLNNDTQVPNPKYDPSRPGEAGNTETIGALDQQVAYWTEMQKDPQVIAALQAAAQAADVDVSNLTKDQFNAYFQFAVAAQPGGIRSGDMSNNLQYKGDSYNAATQLYNNNVTKTSNTYYLPTISDNSGTDNNVIINNYLGNNGRLEIANQMLHVSKLLEPPEGYTLTTDQENEIFNYQIFVQGVTGKRTAARTEYNEYSGTWERCLAYIDVLTDNSDLVQTNNSTRALFVMETDEGRTTIARQVLQTENGLYYANDDGTLPTDTNGNADFSKKVPDSQDTQLYYMYLPSNGSGTDTQHVRRLYQSGDYDSADKNEFKDGLDKNETEAYKEATGDYPAGTQTYSAKDAELIPVNEVDGVDASTLAMDGSGNSWQHKDHTSEHSSDHMCLSYQIFVTRKPSGETSATNFTSPYATRSQYLTVELNFGFNANEGDGSVSPTGAMTVEDLYDGIIPSGDRPDLFSGLTNEQIAKNTAEFTLKHGEGLLLTGLDNRITYRFTEKLTEAQINKGYTLKDIIHIQQRGSASTYKLGTQNIPIYSYDGATYGSNYAPYSDSKTENGLTWAVNTDGTLNDESYCHKEPFAHTNAVMWEYYATMEAGSSGNHHQPAGVTAEQETSMQIWDQGNANSYTATGVGHTVTNNPNCIKCDKKQDDGSILHYMYREGELIDPHYEGEASTYLRNMARYGVSPTVHFAVDGETQEGASHVPSEEASEKYTGVYSVFGNTGWFEEQAHFGNTFKPGTISITKKLEAAEGETLTERDNNSLFSFTLNLVPNLVPSGTWENDGTYSYTITGPGGKNIEGTLKEFLSEGPNEPDGNGVYAIAEDTWAFQLKGGQTMTVSGLPVGSTYTYKVKEETPGNGYIVTDSDVTPEKNDDKTVTGTVTPETRGPIKIVFGNTKKKPEPAKVNLGLTKVLDCYNLRPDTITFEFEFDVEQNSPTIPKGPEFNHHIEIEIDTKESGAYHFEKDAIIFPEDAEEDAVFDEPGTYVYTITEKATNSAGITYDYSVYKVKVEVKEEYIEKTNIYTGCLVATVSIIKNGEQISTFGPSQTVEVGTQYVAFSNRFNPDEVSISLIANKTLLGLGGSPVEFGDKNFSFSLESLDGAPDPKSGNTVATVKDSADGKATAVFDEITFTEAGTYKYEIREQDSEYGDVIYDLSAWIATVTVADTGDGLTASVSYEADNATSTTGASFVNWVESGELEVSKTVTGTAGDPDKDWHFTVTLGDNTITGKYGDMEFTNGVAEFTLKHNESKTATGLPVCITYTVAETDANQDGYTTSWSGETGTITAGTQSKAECTNSKDKKPGDLTVTKTVTGAGDVNKDWTFTVTLSDKTINGPYGDITFTDGVAKFTLKHGESKKATGLPADITYSVTETEANADGYTSTATGAEGTIPEGGTAKAEFVNNLPTPEPQYGDLTVTKTVTGEGDTSKEWHFTVTLSDTTVNGTKGDMDFTNGVAEFTLRHGESKTARNLPEGISYAVTETEADTAGYTTDATGAEGTIPANGTAKAEFVNNLPTPEPQYGSLTVTKTVTGTGGDTSKEWHFTVELSDKTINGTYGDMDFTNGVAEFTLKHGQSATATGLPANVGYEVSEREAGEDGYRTSGDGIIGTIPAGGTAEADFVNHKMPDTGDLTVTKTVRGTGDPDRLWHFTVTLNEPLTGTYGDLTFTGGIATFTLRHGQTVTATGLPAGTVYVVTEDDADTDGYKTTETGAVGTIPAGDTAQVEYINEKTEPGSLTVTKTVRGAGDTEKAWNFRVELSDPTITGTYGGMTFTNGVAEFTLKHGESRTATGLPADVTYTVTEAEANTDGYTTTATGEAGTISAEGEAKAEFVNSKESGDLTVGKILEGESADPNRDWTFTVTLSDTTINGTYGGMTFTNGVATFTLKGGQTLTATGLPAGITYTVTEAEANTDGYRTTSTGETGEITESGHAQAIFTNTIGVGDLTVGKILEGETADPNRDWTFTVTLSDTTINGTYGSMTFVNGVATFTLKGGQTLTATGLPAGITYTVTEAEANTDGYKTTSTGETGEITEGGQAQAIFTNTIGAGDLTVGKILEGENADPNKDWTFTVTLSDPTINGTYGGMTFTNGVATFTLKGGQTLTATGLPAGITYTVTEAEANQDGYTTTSIGESGEIPDGGSAEAIFTNSMEEGDLTVVKNIEGKDADPNKDWTFTVTLSDTTINGTYGGMTFVNGVATFTLKGGESLTATGLPAGISYTVTEAEANTDGYTTRTAGTTGTIPADGEAVATFVNSKGEVEKGDFAVRKRVRGEDADPNQEFHFVITLSDPTINGTYGDVTFTDGVGYATLKDGQHVWILDLPVGTTYTVTEVEANQDGYQTHGEGETGAVPATGHTEARFTNYRGPDEPNWDEPWEDLPDPDVPLAPPEDNPSDNPPQTNDQFNREMWMLMMAAAFLGMTAQFLPGKRKEEA